jgi:hypothetical protein
MLAALILAQAVSAQADAPSLSLGVSTTPADQAPPAASSTLPDAPVPEVPPPLPHKHGLTLEQSLGVLGFAGQFRHVSPPGLWIHTQLGYEFFKWLMPFVSGEVAYADTSEAQDPSKARAFPIFGFGGGVRATFSVAERFALFAQFELGALRTDTPKNSLAILGFRDAEGFNPFFGGRIGFDWLQIDRHLGVGISIGLRDAQGFAKLAGSSDTPLMWDAAAAIRYVF